MIFLSYLFFVLLFILIYLIVYYIGKKIGLWYEKRHKKIDPDKLEDFLKE